MKEFLRMFGQYAVSKGEGWRVGEGAELVDAYEATLNAPADRAPRTYDQEHAIKEGHRNRAEDDYFNARPQVDHNMNRVYFNGGFDRGWDAAKKGAPVDREVMRQALEEIALAGMSPSPEMSPDDVQSWHASRAWEFISIAARALAVAPTPPAEQTVTDGGRNMFFDGRFDDETEREQSARLRWADDMRAAFEKHTGNGWFDKDWRQETALWAAAWRAAKPEVPPAEQPEGPARTGWPEGMLQDDSRELSKALASKPNARAEARSAAEQQREQEPGTLNALEKEGAIELWFKHHSEACGGFSAREKTLIRSAMMATFLVRGCSHPSPSLAELRAKVEALTTFTADHYTFDAETFKQKVLAEIDKLGGKI